MSRLLSGLAMAGLIVGLAANGCGGGKSSSQGSGGQGGSSEGTGGSSTGGKAGGGATGGTPGAGGGAGGSTGGAQGSTGGGGGAATGGAGGGGAPDAAATGGAGGADPKKTTVVIFMIDGLQVDAAKTAAANGATNLKFLIDNGVTVTNAHSTSPAARTTLPDGSLPWGNATSGNIAVHTGTHVYEAGPMGMDDIFIAARAAGIKSVFAGGDANYSGLTTADFHYAASISDAMVVQQAINHIKSDHVRLLRLHLQRIRDDWSGPAGKTDPNSAYLKHIVASDALLGQLRKALEDEGVWGSTYLVVTADHGMGQTSASGHPQSTASSWDIFMGFYGPDLKKGASIPYAELPDVAVTTMRFLGLPPLKGHTAASVNIAQKGPTGVVLTNLFMGAPDEIPHTRLVEQYLKLNTYPGSGDNYGAYRTAMLGLIK
jgi:hypothetical protein